jgi:hypothetical protein
LRVAVVSFVAEEMREGKKERLAVAGKTDQDDAVARGEGEDVGAGDGGRARGLDLRLDVVDEIEAEGGATGVGAGALLACHRGGVVQQQRGVAALSTAEQQPAPSSGINR